MTDFRNREVIGFIDGRNDGWIDGWKCGRNRRGVGDIHIRRLRRRRGGRIESISNWKPGDQWEKNGLGDAMCWKSKTLNEEWEGMKVNMGGGSRMWLGGSGSIPW